ncbi:MAG: hypothetical protein V3S01_04645 [Dehalococcoidia bacterium]
MRSLVLAAVLAVGISGCVGGPGILVDPDSGEAVRPVSEVVVEALVEAAPAAGASGGATIPATLLATALIALQTYRKREVIKAKLAARKARKLAEKEAARLE